MTQVPYTFGNETSPIPLSQLDANFAVVPNFANVANTVLNPVQANITSVGVLTSLSVTGGINAANLTVTDSVILNGNAVAGNLLTGGLVSAYGNVTGQNFITDGTLFADLATVAAASVSGNATVGNISTPGNATVQGIVSATGNIVTAQYFVGNFLGNITGNLSVGGSNTQILFNLNGNVGAAGGLTYNKDSNVLTVLGTASAVGIVSGSAQFTGLVTAPTPITAAANNQVATTAFVNNRVGTLGTMAVQNAISVAILGGTMANVAMSGLITAPTAANGTSNTQVATTAFVANNSIPSGGIIMWSGSIASIPAGWNLCDGTNGTPNLQSRFIVGAGNVYAVGNVGGSTDAVVVSHSHTTSVSDPGHFHQMSFHQTSKSNNATPYMLSNPFIGENFNGTLTLDTTNVGTGISVTANPTGVSGVNANMPPYYALAYIMKL